MTDRRREESSFANSTHSKMTLANFNKILIMANLNGCGRMDSSWHISLDQYPIWMDDRDRVMEGLGASHATETEAPHKT